MSRSKVLVSRIVNLGVPSSARPVGVGSSGGSVTVSGMGVLKKRAISSLPVSYSFATYWHSTSMVSWYWFAFLLTLRGWNTWPFISIALPVNLVRVSPFPTALVLFRFPIPLPPCFPPFPPPGAASGAGLAPAGGGATGMLFAPTTISVMVCVVG